MESDDEPFSLDHSEYEPDSISSSSVSGAENLDGMEEFPVITDKSRKRKRCAKDWKRNIAKARRQRGEAYLSSRGKHVPGVCMKDPCSPKCRQKCGERISNNERLLIFKRYYELKTYERKRDFINGHTEKKLKKWHTKQNSRRKSTIIFYLPINQEKVKVCKTMFINTLGIRKGVVDIAMQKKTSENTTQEDQRGKHKKIYVAGSLGLGKKAYREVPCYVFPLLSRKIIKKICMQ